MEMIYWDRERCALSLLFLKIILLNSSQIGYICGHLSTNVGYLLCSPPEKLYHGTVQKSPSDASFPATEL